MNNIEAICRKIDENPTDKLSWGVLADFLEENGDERYEGIRWLIKKNKYPAEFGPYSNSEKFYSWYSAGNNGEYFDLPSKIGKSLKSYITPKNVVWRDYPTLSSALLAAAEGYINRNKVIHHINGNRLDNRPENITFVDPKEKHQ